MFCGRHGKPRLVDYKRENEWKDIYLRCEHI